MQLRLPFFVFVSLGLAAEAAEAAPGWVDGPAVDIPTQCGAYGTNSRIVTKAGMVIDPIAETPQRGQVVYVHAVATNKNCAAEDVFFDFHFPAGTTLATTETVKCNLYKTSYSNPNNPTRYDAINLCSASPLPGKNGGVAFHDKTYLPPSNSTEEWSYEIVVPVVYSQATDAPITITTSTDYRGARLASIDANVPYQPALPQSTRGEDLVLLGSAYADPGTLPVAFSNDNGSFTVTNHIVGEFSSWARASNVTRLTGDFNRDGYVDYALVGGPGWRTIPVAMSQGNGKFTVTNHWVGDFGAWADNPSVKPVAGDFNRDGHTDIALVGGPGWNTLPIAFSAAGGGNGYFTVTNTYIGDFATWAQAQGARPIVGDYNRDGMSDIALVGGNGWTMLPVAYSYGNGSFAVYNSSGWVNSNRYYHPYIVPYTWNFAQAINEAGAKLVTGDFNKDGMTDLLVVGGTNNVGMRFAMSYGNGTWQMFEKQDANWNAWSNSPNVKVLVGDYNKDGWPDLALTGVNGWGSIPVATNAGGGNFYITNHGVGHFASWSATAGVRQVVGDFNGDGFSDIALTGGSGWGSIPVAFGYGNGIFGITNWGTNRFPSWSSDTSATVFAGRVNY